MDLGRAAGPVAECLLLTGRDRLGVVLLGQVLGLGAGHVAGEDHHVQRAVGALRGAAFTVRGGGCRRCLAGLAVGVRLV